MPTERLKIAEDKCENESECSCINVCKLLTIRNVPLHFTCDSASETEQLFLLMSPYIQLYFDFCYSVSVYGEDG